MSVQIETIHYTSINGCYHEVNSNGIHFSSSSLDRVKQVAQMIENGLTADAIRNNEVPHRHALMLDFSCWGNSKLAKEYMNVRTTRESLAESYVSQFKKGTLAELQAQSNQYHAISEKLKAATGWIF